MNDQWLSTNLLNSNFRLFVLKVYWLRWLSFKSDISLSELVLCVLGQCVCSLCENPKFGERKDGFCVVGVFSVCKGVKTDDRIPIRIRICICFYNKNGYGFLSARIRKQIGYGCVSVCVCVFFFFLRIFYEALRLEFGALRYIYILSWCTKMRFVYGFNQIIITHMQIHSTKCTLIGLCLCIGLNWSFFQWYGQIVKHRMEGLIVFLNFVWIVIHHHFLARTGK